MSLMVFNDVNNIFLEQWARGGAECEHLMWLHSLMLTTAQTSSTGSRF